MLSRPVAALDGASQRLEALHHVNVQKGSWDAAQLMELIPPSGRDMMVTTSDLGMVAREVAKDHSFRGTSSGSVWRPQGPNWEPTPKTIPIPFVQQQQPQQKGKKGGKGKEETW